MIKSIKRRIYETERRAIEEQEAKTKAAQKRMSELEKENSRNLAIEKAIKKEFPVGQEISVCGELGVVMESGMQKDLKITSIYDVSMYLETSSRRYVSIYFPATDTEKLFTPEQLGYDISLKIKQIR